MIISASRRTDIPTCYSEWFFERIREGFVYVRNPINIRMISRIPLNRDVVDGIVFWTKNPLPMLDGLDLLCDYPYYFQFTLTSYGKDIEANVPSKNDVIIPAFRALSDRIGRGWFLYAVGAAVFASLTAILGKLGISGVESSVVVPIDKLSILITVAFSYLFSEKG